MAYVSCAPCLPDAIPRLAPVTVHSRSALLPIGAMLLAGSMGSLAQRAPASGARTLPTVTVTDTAEAPEGKDAVRATTSTIGKGNQQLRDIPQSVTVVTEKLVDDRNLDTLKEALHNTAGITFLAAEGGEEDIRLRGFSLAGTGDIFADGIRDPAFYDRDTFNLDRLEVLRGSASMLFGRGSTGGAVNQVNKLPRTIDAHEISTTLGSHNYRRIVGDFNLHTGEDAALRINAMVTKADNNGSGSSIDKSGVAVAYRFGIGTADEFLASLYYLDNHNGMNYGLPWARKPGETQASNTLISGLDPSAYFGMASDYNAGTAKMATLAHTHRFQDNGELKTQLRVGQFARDQRAGTVRPAAAFALAGQAVNLALFGPDTVFTRGTQLKIQDMDTVHLQSDYSRTFAGLGFKHELLTGIDIASEKKKVYAGTQRRAGRRQPDQTHYPRPAPPTMAPGSMRACACCGWATRFSPWAGAPMPKTWCRSPLTGSCWAACDTTACAGTTRPTRSPTTLPNRPQRPPTGKTSARGASGWVRCTSPTNWTPTISRTAPRSIRQGIPIRTTRRAPIRRRSRVSTSNSAPSWIRQTNDSPRDWHCFARPR